MVEATGRLRIVFDEKRSNGAVHEIQYGIDIIFVVNPICRESDVTFLIKQ